MARWLVRLPDPTHCRVGRGNLTSGWPATISSSTPKNRLLRRVRGKDGVDQERLSSGKKNYKIWEEVKFVVGGENPGWWMYIVGGGGEDNWGRFGATGLTLPFLLLLLLNILPCLTISKISPVQKDGVDEEVEDDAVGTCRTAHLWSFGESLGDVLGFLGMRGKRLDDGSPYIELTVKSLCFEYPWFSFMDALLLAQWGAVFQSVFLATLPALHSTQLSKSVNCSFGLEQLWLKVWGMWACLRSLYCNMLVYCLFIISLNLAGGLCVIMQIWKCSFPTKQELTFSNAHLKFEIIEQAQGWNSCIDVSKITFGFVPSALSYCYLGICSEEGGTFGGC